VVVGVCLLGPLGAAAVAGGQAREDAVDLLNVVPREVHLVVAADNLNRAWETPAIATAISTLQAVTDLTGTLDAWTVLAGQLGMRPDDAARRILGKRFLLISEPDGAGEAS